MKRRALALSASRGTSTLVEETIGSKVLSWMLFAKSQHRMRLNETASVCVPLQMFRWDVCEFATLEIPVQILRLLL